MEKDIKISENYFRLLEDVTEIVLTATKIIQDHHPSVIDYEKPSTELDKNLDKFLTGELNKLLPASALSEESGFVKKNISEVLWIIDPIDGTYNVISGSPDVAISVALATSEFKPIMSVVATPYYDKIYTAFIGRGAFCNNRELKISLPKKFPKTIAIGLSDNAKSNSEVISNQINRLIKKDWILRQSGSAAIDVCRVAEGCWCAFVENELFLWDIAGASLIAQEAGCLTKINNDKYRINPENFRCNYLTACNEQYFKELNKIFYIE